MVPGPWEIRHSIIQAAGGVIIGMYGSQDLGAVFKRLCMGADAPQGTLVIRVPFPISRSSNETTLKADCVSKISVRKFVIR
jgi:hypothetical protein